MANMQAQLANMQASAPVPAPITSLSVGPSSDVEANANVEMKVPEETHDVEAGTHHVEAGMHDVEEEENPFISLRVLPVRPFVEYIYHTLAEDKETQQPVADILAETQQPVSTLPLNVVHDDTDVERISVSTTQRRTAVPRNISSSTWWGRNASHFKLKNSLSDDEEEETQDPKVGSKRANEGDRNPFSAKKARF